MGTTATIGIKDKDDKVRSIYLHNDGNIKHTGLILYLHYNTREKVEELIANGGMSVIGRYINPIDKTKPHNFDNVQLDTCVFYKRDQGDDLEIITMSNEKIHLNENTLEFNYLFKNNRWYVMYEGHKTLHQLSMALQCKGLLDTNADLIKQSIKITNIQNSLEDAERLIVEYEQKTYEIVYYVEDDVWHFFYKDGKKPADIDFEYKLMCCL